MTITATNNVIIHTSLTNNSDAKLARNTKDIVTEDAINMLKNVNVKTYDRVDLPNSKSRLGFTAQDIQNACPTAWGNLVSSFKETDDQNVETETLSLDYARLCCVLWECSKNLLARVEVLETKLNSL